LSAVKQAASAVGEPWPYLVAENDPINDGLTNVSRDHVMNGQWHFWHHYDLAGAAFCSEDKSFGICSNMNYPHDQLRPYFEVVRYSESHDSTSAQEDWKRRIVSRTPFDLGYQMAKAVGAAGILAKGVPMIFMGQEAGEHMPFLFGMDNLHDPSRYLRLDDYLNNYDNRTILAWFNSLIGLRNNPSNGFRGDDNQKVGRGNKTIAFTRGWERFFVVATFGTPDTVQNLGWLGLPGGTYKEIFNSSWPVFSVKFEPERTNGGYDGRLHAGDNINLPAVGAVVLERV
jgi:1,4-alpha-glucan branching enzyme